MIRFTVACALLLALTAAQEKSPAVDSLGDPIPAGATFRLGSGRLQHGDMITGLAWSRDGKRIITNSWNFVRVWDAEDGRLLSKISGGQGEMEAMAVAPDGKTVYTTGCNILHVHAWDAETGKEKFRFQGFGDSPSFTGGGAPSLAISGDGRRLASCMRDGAVRVWDLEKGREILKRVAISGDNLSYHAGMALSPDGRLVAASSPTATYVIEVDTGRVALKVEKTELVKAAFSPDSKRIACGGVGKVGFQIWDIERAHEIYKTDSGAGFHWSPDGSICAWWEKGSIAIADAATGDVKRRVKGGMPPWYLAYIGFSPNGKRMAAAVAHTYSIRLFDTDTARERSFGTRSLGTNFTLGTWDYSPDGRMIASAGAYCPITFWDPRRGRELWRIDHQGHLMSLQFSDDGRTLTTFEITEGTSQVRRWDVLSGRELSRCDHDSKLYSRGGWLAAGGRYLVSGGVLVDAGSGAVVRKSAEGEFAAFSADGRRAILKGRKLTVVELDPWRELWSEQPPWGMSYDTAYFTQDGREILVAGQQKVRVLDAATGTSLREIATEAKGSEYFYFSAVSHDGKTFATHAYNPDRIDHWDSSRPGTAHSFHIDERPFRLRFSPDGSTWAASLMNSTILIWTLKPPPPELPAAQRDLAALWAGMSSKDMFEAWSSAEQLAGSKDAVAYLKEKLSDRMTGPPPADDASRQRVAALESDDLAAREAALKLLREAGASAEAALLRALDATPTAETDVRIRRLLDAIASRPALPGDESRRVLSARVLEKVESAGGRTLLDTLRLKAPTWAERQDAASALKRIASSGE